jgi:hypothetical protein
MSNLDFDAQSYDREPDKFDVIPAGEYTIVIEDTEKCDTKDPSNENQYLKLTCVIQGGQYNGRKIFDNINYWNANITASTIAKNTLYDICHAINLRGMQNHEELRFKELNAKIGIKKASGEYGEQNEIKKYKTKAAISASVSVTPAAASGGNKPWKS